MSERFRYEYGAQPLHLIAVVASPLLCGYALLRVGGIPGGGRVLIWLVAAKAGRHPNHRWTEGTGSSTSTMFWERIRGRIWTFWLVSRGRLC